MKILIIDFDDSFTYNIANSFYSLFKIEPFVIHWQQVGNLWKEYNIIVWGPGPGHPSEYQDILPMMRKTFAKPKTFNFGICLGHQLYWYMMGGKILPSKQACHGESIEIVIPPWPIFPKSFHEKMTMVQRYNSLCVQKHGGLDSDHLDLIVNDEVIMSAGANFLTMQFHPESIGTSCPDLFFAVARQFQYNI